ncbi:MAG: hypothetical protein Q6366_010760, partial [Candidatus Freyarchaeota archaeon]
YYLAVLLYPFSYIFSGVSPDPNLYALYFSNRWYLVFRMFYSAIERNLVFQGGLLVSQILFYISLGVLLVFVARGLLQMKDWARRVTMVYTILYIILLPVHFLIPWLTGDSLFNINLFVQLHRFISFDGSLYFLGPIMTPLVVGGSLLFATITFYLGGDVKYEFE